MNRKILIRIAILFFYVCVCMCVCVYTCMCVCVHACTCMHVHVCACMLVHVCVCACTPCMWERPRRLEEDVRSPGTGVTGGCELPDVGVRSQAWVVCNNSKYS